MHALLTIWKIDKAILWKKHLGQIPYIWDRLDIETLALADNDFTEVSARIGESRQLRMLDLGDNSLAASNVAIGDSGLTPLIISTLQLHGLSKRI